MALTTASYSQTTQWDIRPSFKYDMLCFLNVMTGDSFYVNYFKDEYEKFEPKITPEAKAALSDLKRIIKDENKNIVSAWLCLYFSAVEDSTIDQMISTLENPEIMNANMKRTPYYNEKGWQMFLSIRTPLITVFRFLNKIDFPSYWQSEILPKVEQKISEVKPDLPKYDVVSKNEEYLGFKLSSNKIIVYMLHYSKPHGIRITGMRFLTDIAWSFKILIRTAAHEMMHPPYDNNDTNLKSALNNLKSDEFLMDKVLNHNPSFGYNSFEGFIEEDCVQALDQCINEDLGTSIDARKRWKINDDGMHVFAVALYSIMRKENYNKNNEVFWDFLIRMINSGTLSSGKIKPLYDRFYEEYKPE